MQEKDIIIKNKLGLHARPAAQLVQAASKFKSKIKILKDDQEVDGKSIMGLMTLAACCGSTLRVLAEGDDEVEAMESVSKIIENGFGEE